MKDKIVIFWSRQRMMQPAFYPYLFNALESLSKEQEDIQVVDINQHSFEELKEIAASAALIVIDHSILMAYSFSKYPKVAGHSYLVEKLGAPEFYMDVWDLLFQLPSTIKKVLIVACDLHAFKKSPAERTDGLGTNFIEDYLPLLNAVAWGFRPNEIPTFSTIPQQFRESWMDDYDEPSLIGRSIISRLSTIIELPSCVITRDIKVKPTKKWDISILGAPYKTRICAIQKVANTSYRLAPYQKLLKNRTRHIYYLRRLKFISEKTKNKLLYNTFHQVQDYLVGHSDYSFVCGSALKYFVLKFYEIPAGNSVLLGYMPAFAADYGFIDGVNYIETRPEEVTDKMDYLNANLELKESIRREGKELIQKMHTADKRAEQFIFALRELAKAPYKEAKFVNGTYSIIR